MDKTIHVNGLCLVLPKSRRYQPIVKYVIAMKLFITILILSLNVSAKIYSQRIDLVVKNQPIRDVLRSIGKQSGYNFLFVSELLDIAKPVTVNLKQASIEEALQQIMKDQPFIYQIINKTITIKPKEKKEEKTYPFVMRKDINGIVQDEKGQPLPGTTVILKEQNNRVTVTDGEGRFSFPNAPDEGTILVRMIGRETKEIRYKNGDVVSFVLKEVDMNLQEVQLIAYGQVTKRNLTSNISSVKGNVIEQAPVSNVLFALAGRVPGVFIQQSSGVSGNAVNVTIQGKNSIGFGNVPFYVIDGVPYTPDVIQTNVRNISSGVGSTMGFINPTDIESIEILKDADATAIYGSRAANGAILITTKKGKPGQTKVDLNMQTGWGRVPKKQKLLNTEQYISLRKEAYSNANATPSASNYDINGIWDQTRYTDWQKEFIGGTAQYQNFQTSISGGSENTQFLVGGVYLRETTVFPGEFSDSKGSAHFNLNHSSSNKMFHFNLTASYMSDLNRLPQTDLTNIALTLAPNAPALYKADGTINWSPSPTNPNVYTFSNPIASLLQKYTERTNNLISNSQISYEIIPNLVAKIGMGYNRLQTNEISTIPWSSLKPNFRAFIPRQSKFADKYIETWISEPQLIYSKELFFGHIDALLGATFQETRNHMQSFNAQGFSNDAQLENIQAAPTVSVSGSLQSTYRYNAFFGRINYRYKNKYLINLSARRDGSSRFGVENLFHNFYAVGWAWIFSQEDFFKKYSPLLSFGKLRVSYGTTGNDQIGDYRFLDLYNTYGVDIPYQNVVGITPTNLPNPYLQWEETRKLNLGLDLNFLNNRITLSTNYFRNRSSNQLLNQTLSTVTGYPNILRNLPATVQNTGLEFLLESNIIKLNKFNWQSSINLTIPRNKLIRYDNLSNSSIYMIGQSINLEKAYTFAGVNVQTGLYQFVNSKGVLTSEPNSETDMTNLIDLNPKLYGGFSNTISYQDLSLDFLIQYVNKSGINYRYPSGPGYAMENQFINVIDHWKNPGDNAELQRITYNYDDFNPTGSAANQSTATITDASYWRLKNVSLSYRLPNNWLKKIHISQCRIYAQGQNLLTISKYYGADPETMLKGSLPPLRVCTIGTQLTF